MHNIAQHLNDVQHRIAHFETQYQRQPGSVNLLAVSKRKSTAAILAAYQAGQHDFGESYLQEALSKINLLANQNITWHFIGPIQSNKTKLIAKHFDWAHSINKIKTAEKLNQHRPANTHPLNILIQVNITEESQKSGVLFNQIKSLAEELSILPKLRLRGLMAIGHQTNQNLNKQAFCKLQQYYQDLQEQFSLDTLSLGMSEDMELAIANGSTLLRIGRAIFGERSEEN